MTPGGSSQFHGLHAEFYDILQADAPDAPFYAQCAQEYGQPVLEIGSGTGRLMLPLREQGIAVVGVEPSGDMIEICRRKLARKGWDAEIIRGTAQSFSAKRRFRWAFIACNTAQLLVTPEEQEQALENIGRHLEPGGRLLIDLSLPDVEEMVRTDGKEQVFEYENPATGNRIRDHFTARYDWVNQVETDTIVLREFEGDRCIREEAATPMLTWFFPRELRLLVERCGYSVRNLWRDYGRRPLDASARMMVLEAARR